MGSVSTNRERGLTTRQFMERELPTTLTVNGKILASAMVGSVFYAAVQNNEDAPSYPGETWALVVLTHRSSGYFNFTYKDMDEGMGPAEAECPDKILDLLSPTEDKYALEWRAACREHNARVAASRKVQRGDTVVFPRAFDFTGNYRSDTFTYLEKDTFLMFGAIRVRLPGWRGLNITVLPKAA